MKTDTDEKNLKNGGCEIWCGIDGNKVDIEIKNLKNKTMKLAKILDREKEIDTKIEEKLRKYPVTKA